MTQISISDGPFTGGACAPNTIQYYPNSYISTSTAGSININAGPYTEKQMTKTTIKVETNDSCAKDFDGENAEARALEYAQERAHASNTTCYLMKAYKIVKPKREVTVEDVV